MPDKDVTTIKNLVYCQYAKIIVRSAFSAPDGTVADAHHCAFTKQTFRELQNKVFTKG